MNLSQAIVCIDKDHCRRISIFKFSPNAINEIFTDINPLSRVLVFLVRKGSVNIVVAYKLQSFPLTNQFDKGVYGSNRFMFNFHRNPTLEQRIYKIILLILCLYENEDNYLVASIAARAAYKNIKNYIKEIDNE